MSEKDVYADLAGRMSDVLSGDTLKNALDFAAFLRANGLTVGENLGEVTYAGEGMCYMHIDGSEQVPGPWTIWIGGDFSGERADVPIDEDMKRIAWEHVNFCADCGGDCSPGTTKVIFGREYDGVCSSDMMFTDPDAQALECAERLLLMKKSVIA